jgi:hypothetical protein
MKNEKTLNSIYKNIPIELKKELSKYKTKNSKLKSYWKARQPVDDCPKQIRDNYNRSGALPFEFAKSADLYVSTSDRYWEGFEAGRKSQSEKTEAYKKDLSRSQLACIERGKENQALQDRIEELVNSDNAKHKQGMEDHYSKAVLQAEIDALKTALKVLTVNYAELLTKE